MTRPSLALAEQVAGRLAPLIPPHGSILVGLSGGVDSVVLLHLLRQLAPRFSWRLSALHVHHGISPNADAWAEFCAALCAQSAIPLHTEHVDIAPLRKHGIEAAARKLRYTAFARQECDFVALAHHADDQAETLLLQLLRGAGVRGASAMPFLSTPSPPALLGKSLRLLRPLLYCSRHDLVDYAITHGLRWIEDESNADDRYARNFLRHRLLPLLEEKFPACRTTLARSAQHFAEAGGLLDDLARLDAHDALVSGDAGCGAGTRLKILCLQALSRQRAKNLLRYFLHIRGAPLPQAVQLDDLLRQLCAARCDASVCIGYGGWEVHRYQGLAYALRAPGCFDRELSLPWQGEAELAWTALGARVYFHPTNGAGISAEKMRGTPVTLRLRQGGETLRTGTATRTLKNLLQEHHIPPWRRERWPLLYCGDELVCVPGVAIAAAYQAGAGETGVQLVIEDGPCGDASA